MKKKNVNPNVIQTMTQIKAIKKHLLKGKKITPLRALNEYGCMRLGARIWDLKNNPYNLPIERRFITVESGKRVAEYYIPKEKLSNFKNN